MPIVSAVSAAAVPPTDDLERQMTLAMALNKLPPLSPLVPRVLALRGKSDAGIAELAKVIGSDPMLTHLCHYSEEFGLTIGRKPAWMLGLAGKMKCCAIIFK